MKRIKDIFIFGIASFLLATAFYGCGKKEDVIKIGLASPLTGDQAAIGQDLANAAILAIDEANEKGGLLGKKILLVTADDKADPKEAVNVAHRFAIDKSIVAVIGHLNSGCTLPASSVYNEAGLAMITPCATNPKITLQGFKNVFRTCTTDAVQGSAGGEFAVKVLKKNKIVVLHDKTPYGQGLAEEFEKSARNNGAKILLFEGITSRELDYTAILTKVKHLQPELIYFGGMYPEGALLAKQMKGLKIKAKFMAGDGLYAPEYINLAGISSDGTIISFLAPPFEEIPTAKEFLKKFNERYGEIKTYAPYAYDTANIIIEAIKRAGEPDRAKVIEEIRKTKNYNGVIGLLTYDENGDNLNKNIYFYEVKSGSFSWIKY